MPAARCPNTHFGAKNMSALVCHNLLHDLLIGSCTTICDMAIATKINSCECQWIVYAITLATIFKKLSGASPASKQLRDFTCI